MAVSIAILRQSVVSKIAAGEVVERPASVVKELLENALDAGARSINVTVHGGGIKLIRVSDDGIGIHSEEAELVFMRHATSKLCSARDLDSIKTLGFRGEALSSISAVSHMDLVTRSSGEEVGTRLRAAAGEITSRETVSAPYGTVVSVENLFFNVPARLKFIKSDAAEKARIGRVFSRYALAFPGVRFRLHFDKRQKFQSLGTGSLRDVLVAVYGAETVDQLLEVSGRGKHGVAVNGYVSMPSLSRSNRREITLFVNGRYVQDSRLALAITRAYHTLLMKGRYPVAVICIALPPVDVDVNVHPAKTEVRFREPNHVFHSIEREVRRTLLNQKAVNPPMTSGWSHSEVVESADWPGPFFFGNSVTPDDLVTEDNVESETQTELPVTGLPILRVIGQVGAAYIVAEGPDGLYLIDQHAAHERILYESYMASAQSSRVESQTLMEAVTVTLDSEAAENLRRHLDALGSLGFRVEPFGGDSFVVRALPAVIAALSPEQALLGALEHETSHGYELPLGEEDRIILRVCKRAAVRAGRVLSQKEQEVLLRQLEKCQSPVTCPHGRPTMIRISVGHLEKKFGRRG